MGSPRPYKVIIIAPTCFYYQVPLFRELESSDRIDLTVYFCTDEGVSGDDVKTAYGADQTWAVEDQLLKGYKFKFLRNYAPRGSYLKSLVGLANLDIWKELSRERPDVVVVTSWMNPTWWLIFLACLRFKIPMFFMTDANFHAERLKSSWKSWIKRRLLGKLLFPNTTGFLCAGTANRMLYEHYDVPADKLFPFAYSWGYDSLIEESKTLRKKKIELRKRFGLPEDAIVILYCGRLSPEKGSIELIEAYRKVSHANKALVLVGDGRLRKQMQEFVGEHELESIYFMGFQNRKEIGQFYALADLFVLPSQKETWGIVVNEALCFSLPVVVSDQVGAGVDLVIPEENGHIFPVGDVAALADRISKLVELPEEDRKTMGEKSQDMVRKWNDRDLAGLLAEYLDRVYQTQP